MINVSMVDRVLTSTTGNKIVDKKLIYLYNNKDRLSLLSIIMELSILSALYPEVMDNIIYN